VRVFDVRLGAKLYLRNLSVYNGFANGNDSGGQIGGGIKNKGGTLKVIRSTFVGNNAVNIGGGIANLSGGKLTVRNSTFARIRPGSACGSNKKSTFLRWKVR
jgi:hypothetical protein